MREERAFVRKLITEPDYDEHGFVNYTHKSHTYRLWYGKIGSYDVPPALVLHGGPGGNHCNLVAFQAWVVNAL
ncbi:MAG: hypothetical protein ACXV3T_07140 [Halobacteriota archaeon]